MVIPRYHTYAPAVKIDSQLVRPGWVTEEFQYTGDEIFYTVDPGDEFRLDIISYRFFDDPSYAWVIALHNGLKDPVFEITAGRVLKIPANLAEVEEVLRARWGRVGDSTL